MSDLLVVTFKEQATAGQAADRLRQAEHGSALSIRDIATVEKDEAGKIHVHQHVAKSTAAGAIGGGFLGLLIGLVFFPVAALAVGAALGAMFGHSLGQHVDKKLVQDVEADLTPNSSAIFVLIEGSAAALVGSLRDYNGTIYQTSLDPEVEQQVADAMKEHSS